MVFLDYPEDLHLGCLDIRKMVIPGTSRSEFDQVFGVEVVGESMVSSQKTFDDRSRRRRLQLEPTFRCINGQS